jgi:hypothetical protein
MKAIPSIINTTGRLFKNRVKKALFILFIVLCSSAHPQDLKIGLHTGIGFYKMEELKGFTTSMYESLPFEAAIISNYPPFFYYQPVFLLAFKKFSVGIQASFSSTGSRISSKDYSGELLFDSKINCLSPGLYADLSLFSVKMINRVFLYAEGGLAFSKMKLSENLTVYDQELLNSSYTFKVRNYYIQPGLQYERTIYKFISAECKAGYFIQTGKSDLKTDKDEMIFMGWHPLNAEWSGFRLGLSVLFLLGNNPNYLTQ